MCKKKQDMFHLKLGKILTTVNSYGLFSFFFGNKKVIISTRIKVCEEYFLFETVLDIV